MVWLDILKYVNSLWLKLLDGHRGGEREVFSVISEEQ